MNDAINNDILNLSGGVSMIKKWLKKRVLLHSIKQWKNYPYTLSVDYTLAKYVAEITSYDIEKIIVWFYQKKEELIICKFQYNRKYYKLENNKITEIDEKEIFHN